MGKRQIPLGPPVEVVDITEDRTVGEAEIRKCFNENTQCLEITSQATDHCWIALGGWVGARPTVLVNCAFLSRASDDTCWVLIAYYTEN